MFDIIYNYITKICLLLLLFARLLLAIKDLIGAMSAAGGLTSLGDVAAAASLGFEGLASAIGISTAALGGFLAIAAGIVAVVAIADLVTESFDEAVEKADKSRSAYEQTASEVESL